MDKYIKTLFFLYITVITVLALLPAPETPTNDKLNHLIGFFILSFLMKWGLKKGYWTTFFWSFLYGVIIEFIQYFIPYRSGEYGDVVADTLGSIFGLFTFFTLKFVFTEYKSEKI
ncbi:VanZ family protein [Persephonella sp.]